GAGSGTLAGVGATRWMTVPLPAPSSTSPHNVAPPRDTEPAGPVGELLETASGDGPYCTPDESATLARRFRARDRRRLRDPPQARPASGRIDAPALGLAHPARGASGDRRHPAPRPRDPVRRLRAGDEQRLRRERPDADRPRRE